MNRNYKHKGIVAFTLTAACVLSATGCGQKQTAEEVRRDFKAEAEAAYASCVSTDDCYLCHGMQEYEGQNNVGIISFNTFRVMPIKVNRYEQGQLIEENTGCLQMQTHKDPDEGFSALLYVDADRGTATGNISFNNDQEVDLSNAARYLCEDHLRELAESLYKSAYGVGIVSFENKKLEAFCDEVISFQSGDYYIDCQLKEENEKTDCKEMRVLIVYTPLRYGKEV